MTAWLPTDDDVTFFETQGYWVAPVLLNEDELVSLRAHQDAVFEGRFETGKSPWQGYYRPSDGNILRKTDNAHWADRTIRALATHAQIGAIAARLMTACTIRLWHDQLLYKPGQDPSAHKTKVGWHQDYQYWQCADRPSLLTAWVALVDVTIENGCMQFLPQSHRWGLSGTGDFFDQDTEAQMDSIIKSHPDTAPVPIILKAGQVSFHHCLTFHGSGPNLTKEPRRSLAVHLMTGETRYRPGTPSDGHMNVTLLHPEPGQIFEGAWFPTLYEAKGQT
jgi:ectoine hydroxylase-related dioxygenase (phytanoyl-CoA dioxygenase family)